MSIKKNSQMRYSVLRHCFLLGVFILLGTDTLCKTIHVPADSTTIQTGINGAENGDTVLVANGTYTGDGNRDIDFMGKTIVVRSDNGPEVTVIDCEGSESDRHRGFYFHLGEDTLSVVDGFTITGGFAPPENSVYHIHAGAGIYCDRSSPTILNSYFIANKASYEGDSIISFGGAIYCDSSSPIIVACTFKNNYAFHGGGIKFDDFCLPTLRDCQFNGNTGSQNGVAINCHYGCDMHLTNCQFGSNSGTAVYLSSFSTAFLLDCIFDGNQNGFCIDGGRADLTNCAFVNHSGYGFKANDSDVLILSDCIFWNNEAEGFKSWFSGVTLINCSFANNHTGMYPSYGSMTLENCIIAFSTSGQAINANSCLPQLSCCNLYGNAGGDWVAPITPQYGINGNFSSDPLFCDTASGDLGLLEGSPCLPENNDCGVLIGAVDGGCATVFPIADNINYGPDAEGNIVPTLTPPIIWSYRDIEVTTQAQYHIQVGTDDDWTVAEMWDTEPVTASDTNITYDGEKLTERVTYYLRVKLHNGSNWGDWRERSFVPRLDWVIRVPADFPTIQAAIDSALVHDTVMVASGVYTGENNRDIEFGGKALVLQSEDGPEFTFIDCQGTIDEFHRGFWIKYMHDSSLTIDGFTITGGYVYEGGGLVCRESSNMTVKNCVFVGNSAETGGAIWLLDGSMTVTNCTFVQNSTASDDEISFGTINLEMLSSMDLENCIIAFNDGAGIGCSYNPDPDLVCCDIYGNTKGDWTVCIMDQLGENNNFSLDPLFCDTTNGFYKIQESSPCAPSHNPCGVLIGAAGVGCDFLCGDADQSGNVDIDDVVYLLNYIFAAGPAPVPIESGDVDCSGGIDIDDVVYLIAFIFSGGPEPCAECP